MYISPAGDFIESVSRMEFLVITGMSGAGKSHLINALEDIGFFCVDNVPSEMIIKFAELNITSNRKENFALITDVRSLSTFSQVIESVNQVRDMGISPKLVFLDCESSILAKRYRETRRRHPLVDNNIIKDTETAVKKERELLDNIKESADFIIDTTFMTTSQLREYAKELFKGEFSKWMSVRIMSFGFKYGTPVDADLLFDVRCLSNPYYVDVLKEKTGLDKEVRDFVFGFDEAKNLFEKIRDLIQFSLPLYMKEGKSQLVIAFGCTGGKHRSVSYAIELGKHIGATYANINLIHRDINKK